MFDILRIAGLVLKETSSLVTSQFFWLIFLLLVLMYKKSANIENVMMGKKFPLLEKVSGSLVSGIAGGLIGSLLVMILGITLQSYTNSDYSALSSGILYIWVIAILLAMINPRYLCFSYAGGIIALSNLILGFPNINVPGILALIGILHLIESVLIRLDGYTYSVPLFLKRRDGKIVGGYMMNKMWPIPLVLLAFGFSILSGDNVIGLKDMPAWWPIMKQGVSINSNLGYLPFLVPVVLGYGDIAITKTPEKRCKEASVRLAVYSIVLILLSIASTRFIATAYIAAVFAPLAHEFIIVYGKKEEEEGVPLFDSAAEGVTVLFTRKNSPASSMKLEPGDKILSINNNTIDNEIQLAEFLSTRPSVVWLEIRKTDGSIKSVEYQDYGRGVMGLGALIVPTNASLYFELNESTTTYKRIKDYFKRKEK